MTFIKVDTQYFYIHVQEFIDRRTYIVDSDRRFMVALRNALRGYWKIVSILRLFQYSELLVFMRQFDYKYKPWLT